MITEQMDFSKLERLSYTELKTIARDNMNMKPDKTKVDLIKQIKKGLQEFEEYKHKKLDKYSRHEQLGTKGKEGITFRVTTKDGTEYAMKTFKKTKSSDTLRKEASLQKLASEEGVSPEVIDMDTVSKYIVMTKMDKHMIDYIQDQNGNLTETQQRRIITIFKKLDKVGVFQGDSNLLNYMYKGSKMYIIDFGLAKDINQNLVKKLGTSTPNMDLMLLGFVLKLKEVGCPESSYNLLKKHISESQRTKFKI